MVILVMEIILFLEGNVVCLQYSITSYRKQWWENVSLKLLYSGDRMQTSSLYNDHPLFSENVPCPPFTIILPHKLIFSP